MPRSDGEHAAKEPMKPGVLTRLVLPRAVWPARDADLQFHKPALPLVGSADSGDRAGIIANGVLVGHTLIVPKGPSACSSPVFLAGAESLRVGGGSSLGLPGTSSSCNQNWQPAQATKAAAFRYAGRSR